MAYRMYTNSSTPAQLQQQLQPQSNGQLHHGGDRRQQFYGGNNENTSENVSIGNLDEEGGSSGHSNTCSSTASSVLMASANRISSGRRLGRIRNVGKPQRLGFSEKKGPAPPEIRSAHQEGIKSVRRLETICSMEDDEGGVTPLQTTESSTGTTVLPLRERHPSDNGGGIVSEFKRTISTPASAPHRAAPKHVINKLASSSAPDLPHPPSLSSKHQNFSITKPPMYPMNSRINSNKPPQPTQINQTKKPMQEDPSQLRNLPPGTGPTPIKEGPSMNHMAKDMMTPLRTPVHNDQNFTPMNLLGTSMQNQPGNKKYITVNNKTFVALKVIGKGGSSKVYEVFDADSQLRAIKKVDLSDTDDQTRADYLNEINMLKRLQNHDRIVKMFDYEFRKSEELLFVVMERGDTDLSSVLKTHVTDSKIKFYWEEMLNVVNVIHKCGIIHSDLKPANFLLVAGMLKLIDFGIASAVQNDATSVLKDSQAGTFNFMSPEAISDLNNGGGNRPKIKISTKSDVWSLGCILYSLTYGRTPFADQRQPWLKLQAIVNPNHPIKYPSLQGKDPHLIDSIKHCLVRDVEKRATIDELLKHPYLKPDTARVSEAQNPKNVDHLLSLLNGALPLTPNTREGLRRAQNKLKPQGHLTNN